jgi:hypothetical protein
VSRLDVVSIRLGRGRPPLLNHRWLSSREEVSIHRSFLAALNHRLAAYRNHEESR